MGNGVYNLQLNEKSEIYKAYCQMSGLSQDCIGGGWTLVMKINGYKVKKNLTIVKYGHNGPST